MSALHVLNSTIRIFQFVLILIISVVTFLFPACRSMQPSNQKETAVISVTNKFSKVIAGFPNRKVAVIDFTAINGTPSDFGALFAERLTTELSQHNGITVIERKQIKKILDEQNFSLSGAIDPASSVKMGNLLGADAIILGTVAPLKGYYEINARLINAEKGTVISALSAMEPFETTASGNPQGVQSTGMVHTVETVEPAARPESGKVEIIESKMEKIKDGVSLNYFTIRIIGKGKYLPSTVKPKLFKDVMNVVKVDLLDNSGKKITNFSAVFYCGEYGRDENVSPNETFPFKAEDLMVKKDVWENISDYRFVSWRCD